MELLIAIVLLIGGFLLLIKGADFFVDSASEIAMRFNISSRVIGLTIVALGTSLPEAAVSIDAAFNGSGAISIGNVVGSNIMNVLIILGITAVITAIPVQKTTIKLDIPFMLLASVLLLVFGLTGNTLVMWEGIVFSVLFIGYLLYLAKNSKDEDPGEPNHDELKPVWVEIILLVLGAAAIVFGSDITVEGATSIARILNMNERLIGLTIVALGTSLPELVTSITAARKGETDIAIGNIVGSNIFNILFVIGVTALITPVEFQASFLLDTLVAIGAGILLWVFVLKTKKLTRPAGIVMLLCYAGYFVSLLLV